MSWRDRTRKGGFDARRAVRPNASSGQQWARGRTEDRGGWPAFLGRLERWPRAVRAASDSNFRLRGRARQRGRPRNGGADARYGRVAAMAALGPRRCQAWPDALRARGSGVPTWATQGTFIVRDSATVRSGGLSSAREYADRPFQVRVADWSAHARQGFDTTGRWVHGVGEEFRRSALLDGGRRGRVRRMAIQERRHHAPGPRTSVPSCSRIKSCRATGWRRRGTPGRDAETCTAVLLAASELVPFALGMGDSVGKGTDVRWAARLWETPARDRR